MGFREAPLPGFSGAGFEGQPVDIPAPHYTDHRSRLRERFDRAGAISLADYELLELVLFRAIPRRDVKPLAKALLKEFGDFAHVISAPEARLKAVNGLGEAATREFKVVEAAAHRLAQGRVMGREALMNWTALMDYCMTAMSHREIEEFRVLFLDRKNVLIADEPQAKGTIDHVPVYPREVAKRALELNASSLILVHNHPSGDPTPSAEDISMTEQVEAALKTLGLTLIDHVVIGKGDTISFRAVGYI